MQRGEVDLVIVGTDRTTCTGDVANKIGTYLKALAAKDNEIPFYVALPSSSIDWKMRDGRKEIPIEQRSAEEVKRIGGWLDGRALSQLPGCLCPDDREGRRGVRARQPGDLMARADEFGNDGGADPAGCAGDEDMHKKPPGSRFSAARGAHGADVSHCHQHIP